MVTLATVVRTTSATVGCLVVGRRLSASRRLERRALEGDRSSSTFDTRRPNLLHLESFLALLVLRDHEKESHDHAETDRGEPP
jgi:hypothetical protein